jgi:hypothetical protein
VIKFTDPEKLKNHALASSKWLRVQDFDLQAPQTDGVRLVEQWKQESKIFSLVHENVEFIPEYVLDQDRNPKSIIQAILHLFEGKKSSLAIAIWFMSVNGWLRGNTPISCLEMSPDAVLEAARMEAFPSEHG